MGIPLAIVTDKAYLNHLMGPWHPEQPARLLAILKALKDSGLSATIPFLSPHFAAEDDLMLCHSKAYIELVKNETAQILIKHLANDGSASLSTGDTPICSASYQAACLAAGGALKAVDAVMQNQVKRVFVAARPPGHHAHQNIGQGFCIFNNVAIAARYAQQAYALKKILIVDWDVHHGDGTQAIFYEDPLVFYFSTHRYGRGFYPGTGAAEERGNGRGLGTNLNCPFSIENGDSPRQSILKAFKNNLPVTIETFKPELIFISAGFDAHKLDPLGGCDLSDGDFAELTECVKEIANRNCQGRIISILEGGYSLEGLASAAIAHLKALQ